MCARDGHFAKQSHMTHKLNKSTMFLLSVQGVKHFMVRSYTKPATEKYLKRKKKKTANTFASVHTQKKSSCKQTLKKKIMHQPIRVDAAYQNGCSFSVLVPAKIHVIQMKTSFCLTCPTPSPNTNGLNGIKTG